MVFFSDSPLLNFFFEVALPPIIIAVVLLRLILSFHRRTFAGAMQLKSMAMKKNDNLSQNTPFSDLCAAVVVCGDIARSPRMQYHAVSLCESADFKKVHIVGSDMGNRCCEKLEQFRKNQKALFCLVKEDESTSAKAAAATATKQQQSWMQRVVKRVYSLFGVYYTALKQVCQDPNLSVVLVQTPPVIPTLPIVFLVVTIENIKRAWKAFFNFGNSNTFNPDAAAAAVSLSPPINIVFDVHNLGWTILKAERRSNLFVQIYKVVETIFCRTGFFSDARITVAEALGDHLLGSKKNGKKSSSKKNNSKETTSVVVMPDSAPDFFRPSSRSEFFHEVLHPQPKIEFGSFGNNIPSWYYSLSNTNVNTKNLVIAASTSWTADDDYTVVVDALKKVHQKLVKINENISNKEEKSHIWLFVSGKGPSRGIFEDAVREAKITNYSGGDESTNKSPVTVTTGYFQSFSDYALFLGASDLGLCLHHSSSGLDLPMKGVDMLGAGLPVCALKYEPALKELVTSESGWIFENSDELAQIWIDLVSSSNSENNNNDDDQRKKLENARIQVQKNRKYWVSSWEENVVPLLLRLLGGGSNNE